MLNWIDKNERLPTELDTNLAVEVYALTKDGRVVICHLAFLDNRFTHWLPFREMPLPKRWRTPTIHDLAKSGKPIPCRVRDSVSDDWNKARLCAIDVSTEVGRAFRAFMSDCGSWYYVCEIEE